MTERVEQGGQVRRLLHADRGPSSMPLPARSGAMSKRTPPSSCDSEAQDARPSTNRTRQEPIPTTGLLRFNPVYCSEQL